MTDKPVIVDGIYVEGYGHYWNGRCHAYVDNTGKFLLCINSPNCYYKQLKRKEQECEELKRELQAQLKRKEQECEELKQWKKGAENLFKAQIDNPDKIINRYKQALDEIKSILEFYANSNMGEEQPDKTYHIMLNDSYIMIYDPKPARQALQKISEVHND